MAKIGIRCDCSIKVGNGHLSQQALIAKELQKLGHEVSFYIVDGELLWQEDLKLRPLYELEREDLLIIDLLHQEELEFSGKKIIFHCFPEKKLFDADLIFAPNVLQKKEWYDSDRYFTGPKYKPMEPEISEINREFGKINNILLMTSGVDIWNIPYHILSKIKDVDSKIMVKVPPQFDDEQIRDLKHLRPDVKISYFESNVYRCYEWADLLITTAGNALIEALPARLPSISIAVVNIQDRIAGFLEKSGFSVHLGMFQSGLNYDRLFLGLDFFRSVNERIYSTNRGRRICDGKGLGRCVGKIQELLDA